MDERFRAPRRRQAVLARRALPDAAEPHFRGEIVHKGQFHPGEHTPIVAQPLWDAVQAQLASNVAGTRAHEITNPASSPACCLMATATG
jgi:hypothetical protein